MTKQIHRARDEHRSGLRSSVLFRQRAASSPDERTQSVDGFPSLPARSSLHKMLQGIEMNSVALMKHPVAGVRKRWAGVNFRPRWRIWSGGRVAEGTGLLNRHRGSTPIEGSNPSRSAKIAIRQQ